MFRTIVQIPTWSTPAYVCHRCRHSMVAATAAAQKHRKRYATAATSTSADASNTNDVEEHAYDDWISNFNDIGDTSRSRPPPRKDAGSKTPKPVANGRTGRTAESLESDIVVDVTEAQKVRPGLSQHPTDRGSRRAIVRRRATVRGRPVKDTEDDVELSESSLPPMRVQLDGLIASMRLEMSARDGTQRSALSPEENPKEGLEKDKTSAARLPNPFGYTALGDVTRSNSLDQPMPRRSQEAKDPMERVASSKDEWDTAFLGSLQSQPSQLPPRRRSPFTTHRSSHPLLSKAQITNERVAWGDSTASASRDGANAASYETLRKADRLSTPDPINPRQSDTRSWGGRPLVNTDPSGASKGTSSGVGIRYHNKVASEKWLAGSRGNGGLDRYGQDTRAARLSDLRGLSTSGTSEAASSPSTAEGIVDSGAAEPDVHANFQDTADLADQEANTVINNDESHETNSDGAITAANCGPIAVDQVRTDAEGEKGISSGSDQGITDSHERLSNLYQKRPGKLRSESGLLLEVRERVDALESEIKHQSIVRNIISRPSEVKGRRGRTRTRAVPKHTASDLASEKLPSSAKPTSATNEHTRLPNVEPAGQSDVLTDVDTESADHDAAEITEDIQDSDIRQLNAGDLHISPLEVDQPAVPQLAYGLDRVLFNPGVYQLQDPHSRVYNFDPYLQKIMPVTDFDFNALKVYKTSSQDTMLSDLAKQNNKRYVGSTSSMTSTLSHFHFLLSNFRDLNLNMMSKAFPDNSPTLTKLNRAPTAMFLRWQNGTYAVDADKEFDSGNVLMMLGKSMELLLTRSQSEYERYRKSDPREVSKEDQDGPEAYQYTSMGDFLMRSQLDAHDPRLPGTGTFDLKTRAVVSVRMNAADYVPMIGYEIHTAQGRWNSYEREYYDMIRSTMLKYSLQARMGRMDGIFVAYHNVTRIFGFQYISINEMDRALHGQVDRYLGDQEFKLSIDLYNKVLDMATEKYPETSLRFFFETRPGRGDRPATMTIFAEPMEDKEIDRIQNSGKARIVEFEKSMMGKEEKLPREVDMKSSEVAKADGTLPVYANTETAADPSFISRIQTSTEATHRPLFCATVLLYNYTKLRSEPETAWQHCEGNRPTNLTVDREWRVEYILKEPSAEMSESTRWAMYEDMKHRRKEAYWKGKEEGEEEAIGQELGKKDGSDYFRDLLRSMSAKDAGVRKKLDRIEEGKEKTVVGMPVFRSATTGANFLEEISLEQEPKAAQDMPLPSGLAEVESVDEYMQLLYGGEQE